MSFGLRTRWPLTKTTNRRRSATRQRPIVNFIRRLRFEPLEERRLLSLTVTTMAEQAGNGGLVPVRVEQVDFASALSGGGAALAEPAAHAEFGTAAHDYVLARRDALGLSLADDFVIRSVFTGMDGLEHVRLDQHISGVRVWGADVVVHLTPDVGQVLFVSGNLLSGADLAIGEPTISAADAIDIGISEYTAWAADAAPTHLLTSPIDLAFERESAELVVYAGAGEPVLAWNVEFFTEQQAGLDPGLWNFFIDAHSGEIVDWFDFLAHAAQASGPGGNARVGDRPWVDALDVEETLTPELYTMDTTRFVTTNLGGAESGTGTVVTGPLDPIGDAAINDAHGFTEITLDMLDEWFGYDSIDNAGFKIVSRVHYGVAYDNNAFWEDGQVSYGDGRLDFTGGAAWMNGYPNSGAVDIVSHEIHHGFTQFHSGLVYQLAPGALNESFSDVAGTVAEFYWEGLAADFLVGEDIHVTGFDRSMTDPMTSIPACLDDAILFSPGLGPHTTSGIGNKAFARTALRLSSGSPTGPATIAGVRRAGEAWFLANESYWTASTNYTQGGQGVYDAAEALGFTPEELLAIRDSWADVGVFFEGSTRFPDELLTATSGTLTSPNHPGNYPHNYKHTWAIDPPGDTPVTVTFSSFQVSGTVSDALEIRDAAGTLLSRTSSSVLPPPATATRLLVTFATSVQGNASGWSASWTSPELPDLVGDYNQNANVDVADYVVWRKTIGTTGVAAYSGADGDGDTEIGPGDYGVWRAHFGQTQGAGSGTASPAFTEPAIEIGEAATPTPAETTLAPVEAEVDLVWAGGLAMFEARSSRHEPAARPRERINMFGVAQSAADPLLLLLANDRVTRSLQQDVSLVDDCSSDDNRADDAQRDSLTDEPLAVVLAEWR